MNRCLLWAAAWLLVSAGQAAERTAAPAAPPSEAPPATVGGKGGEPASPIKGVEEPVFQLPELVIIGENQARIMAQKEQLTGTLLKGLHEAPLLEKEEGVVTALRQRDSVPGPAPLVTGHRAAIKLEAGTAGWIGGAGWVGTQQENSFMGGEVAASRLVGVPVGLGHAGGMDAAGMFSMGEMTAPESRSGTGIVKWLSRHQMDTVIMETGVAVRQRDLPYQSATAAETMYRLWMSTDGSDQPSGDAGSVRVAAVREDTPAGKQDGVDVAGMRWVPLWHQDAWAIRARARLEGEAAEHVGNHLLPGALVQAEWVPGEQWRGEAGVNAEGVFGGGVTARSLRPVGGLSWTTPTGPTIAARFAPSMNAPWFGRAAAENPYAAFSKGLVPERELANAELSAWEGWHDGTSVRGAFRLVETRNAATWAELPGGQWTPAQVPGLRTQELALDASTPVATLGEMVPGSRWTVAVGGRWRTLVASAGQVTNVPRAEGSVGLTAGWNTLSGDLTGQIVRWRPRTSVAGVPELPPFFDLGVGVVWKPVGWGQAFARVSNLAGSPVVRWAGYPEPRSLFRVGAIVSF